MSSVGPTAAIDVTIDATIDAMITYDRRHDRAGGDGARGQVSEVSGGPIGDLARAVAERRCTALAAVEQALERITARDGEIGAVIALRAEQACAEAAKLDQEMADEQVAPGPLAGVPVLVKDLEDVAVLPTRKGSLLLARLLRRA
jgi:Asp-tRNA(Asn)/Glu-tRNA(Gln) amidotransferase A subunit family amidase